MDNEEGQQQFSDFDYDDGEVNSDLEDIDNMYERLENYEEEESRLDEDLDPEFRDGDNRECLQAMAYDRAFVINGPVVKVYKNGDEDDDGNAD